MDFSPANSGGVLRDTDPLNKKSRRLRWRTIRPREASLIEDQSPRTEAEGVRVHDLIEGRVGVRSAVIREPSPPHWPRRFSFSPDGTVLAYGGLEDAVRLRLVEELVAGGFGSSHPDGKASGATIEGSRRGGPRLRSR
jgi:hypothetical protein